MVNKVSKTARASSGKAKAKQIRPCPECGAELVATKVVKGYFIQPAGMYWVCTRCQHRQKLKRGV
jgi:ssDNA-binding Zn-finger/Zn-ribbon topoisomerase 1